MKGLKRICAFALTAVLLTACGGDAPEKTADVPIFDPAAEAVAALASVPLPDMTLPAVTQPPETEPPEPEKFLLTFTGDCTFGADEGIYYAQLGFIKTVGKDMSYPFRYVHTYFEEDDFTMVNLEGVLADRGNPVPKAFNFRGPTYLVEILTQGSVEAVTLANNHTHDYGEKGYRSTLDTLDNAGVPYVERDSVRLVTTDRGLTIGLYGMVYYDLDVEAMKAGIEFLKGRGAQLIIVAPHWGIEGNYMPEQEQKDVAYAAIDAGAHIVYGTHPHVLQPIEKYNGGIIYYSLGNFSFGGNGAPPDMDTAIIRQEVLLYPDGTVELGETRPIPTCVSSVSGYNNYQPQPYEEGTEEYNRVLSKLAGTYDTE